MNVLKNKYISYINILNIKCIRIGLIYIINVNIKHLFFLELFLVSIIVFLQLNKKVYQWKRLLFYYCFYAVWEYNPH